MTTSDILLIGAPVDSGKARRGCLMGPDAYRTAGIIEALDGLGHAVVDRGNLAPAPMETAPDMPGHVHAPGETAGWTAALAEAGAHAAAEGLPIFLGGDHSLSLGSVAGVAADAARRDRPQFILWLDAHADIHTPQSTDSGNLHGTPIGYVTGRAGFHGFP
jgi:arginase